MLSYRLFLGKKEIAEATLEISEKNTKDAATLGKPAHALRETPVV